MYLESVYKFQTYKKLSVLLLLFTVTDALFFLLFLLTLLICISNITTTASTISKTTMILASINSHCSCFNHNYHIVI